MIVFKQFPLGGFNTFEGELLFLLAGNIQLIAGISHKSMIDGDDARNLFLICCDSVVDTSSIYKLCKIFKKYNKSFKENFEIRLTKQNNGRWKLNIKEDMDKPSGEVLIHVR